MNYIYGMNKIDTFAYESGLLCDGTPDSFDSKAIELFAEKILSDVINIVMDADTKKITYTTYDKDVIDSVKLRIVHAITKSYLK